VVKFRAELELSGKTATGITVPADVLDALGSGRRPAVAVTINRHTFRTTLGVVHGVPRIPVSATVRVAAKVSAGDLLDVEIVVDMAPRMVTPPDDLADALNANDAARALFDELAYSRKKAYVTWIEEAKQPTTRARRIEQTVAQLAEHRPQR
jgi:hypothetical protein